jgi:hypothetical protein
MGVPTSEVGYTTAMPRREDYEVHKDMWWQWGKKRKKIGYAQPQNFNPYFRNCFVNGSISEKHIRYEMCI